MKAKYSIAAFCLGLFAPAFQVMSQEQPEPGFYRNGIGSCIVSYVGRINEPPSKVVRCMTEEDGRRVEREGVEGRLTMIKTTDLKSGVAQSLNVLPRPRFEVLRGEIPALLEDSSEGIDQSAVYSQTVKETVRPKYFVQ